MAINFCGDCSDVVKKRYDKDRCKIVSRAYGSDKFIAFHCSVDFTNILDTATGGEWETMLTNNKIILSPFFGNFEMGTASSDTFEDGCGNKYPDTTEVPWTFTTPSTADDYSDEDWWYNLHQQFQYYTVGIVTCEGRLQLKDDVIKAIKASLSAVAPALPAAVKASAPGFNLSLNTIPQFGELNGKGKAGQWKAEGTFLTDAVIRSVDIPGLATLLRTKG